MMFFYAEGDYTRQIKAFFRGSSVLDCAVAFWGAESTNLIELRRGRRTRIVCDLVSGATNPWAIEKIYKRKNVQVKILDRLHAKVLVSNKAALVGSANISTNGLGREDGGSLGWLEAGVHVQGNQISEIQAWFDKIWKRARKVSRADIDNAKLFNPQKKQSFLQAVRQYPDLFKSTFVCLVDEPLDEDAEDALKNAHPDWEQLGISAYQGWTVPKEAFLLEFWVSNLPNGSLKIGNDATIYRRLERRGRIAFGNRKSAFIDLVQEQHDIRGWTITSQEINALKNGTIRLAPIKSKRNGYALIPIEKVVAQIRSK